MREIKFRAWDKCKSRMVFFDLWDSEVSIPASDSPIMQYIGLKDKNGREIYEGDILKDENNKHYNVVPMCGGLSLINIKYYGQQHNELIASPTNDIQNASWIENQEVIGNVWGNPELIKEKI
jgi:uncharacterized phage protein (TIGR01671 family)